MDKLYCKWVGNDMTTRNNTKWEINVPKEIPSNDLSYEDGFFYEHPLLAVMFKSFHQCENYSRLYEVKPEGEVTKNFDKYKATNLTLVKELEIPKVSSNQKVAFGILCAKKVYDEPNFINWANDWLNAKDRSAKSATKVWNIACDTIASYSWNKLLKFKVAAIQAAVLASRAAVLYEEILSWQAAKVDEEIKSYGFNFIRFDVASVVFAHFEKEVAPRAGESALYAAIAADEQNNKSFNLVSLAKQTMEVY